MDFVFDPSLVLYLPLYELDGSSFMSKDAYGHECDVAGALWRPYGRYFDGTDDSISVPDHSALDITDAITLEQWVQLDSTWAAHGVPISKYEYVAADDNNGFRIRIMSTRTIEAAFANDAIETFTTTGTLSVSTWYHLVVVFEGASGDYIRVYVNGQAFESESGHAGSIKANSFSLLIGAGDSNQDATLDSLFKGLSGESRVYSRILTPLEIQHNYLATKWRYR